MSIPSEAESVDMPVDVEADDIIPTDVEGDNEEEVIATGGKRSIVWDHYHPYKDNNGKRRARCNYCPKNYAAETRGNGTSNMLNHMPKCVNHPNYQSHSIEDFCQASKLTNENPREMAGFKKFDKLLVGDAVAKFIMLDEQPFNIVEKEGFIRLMSIAYFSKHDINGPKAYPIDLDWDNESFMATILEHFRGVTIRVSSCSYVTANIFFDEIACIYTLLKEWMNAEDESLKLMAISMKEKFDKYWGVDSDKANLILFVASMLDPRYKFFMVNLGLCHMFGGGNGPKMAELALNALKELYEEYKNISPPNPVPPSTSSSHGSSKNSRAVIGNRLANKLMKPKGSFYKEMEATVGVSETQSELEKYLAANRFKCNEDDDEFQVLNWWRDHQSDYPVLARLARDIFAIPISTVASESAFSTGGRVIDDFRASLSSSTTKALICGQNWLRDGRILTDDEEFELIQKLENELKTAEGDEESGIGHEE